MARHARRLILWTGAAILALLLLALLVIVVVVLTIDPDRFRGRIETAASAALGRSVQLSGGLHWHLGWRTAIESRGGQIANAPGFGSEPFARWEALRFGVAVRPLLHRELHIDRMEVDGLQLRLQRDATGASNWKFTPSTAAVQTPAVGKPSALKLQVGSIALRDAEVLYQDAVAARDWQFVLISFDAQLPPDPLAMQLEFGGVALSGQARGAPFAAPGVAFGLQARTVKFDRSGGSLSLPDWKLQWAEAQMEGSLQARTMPSVSAQGRLSLRAPSLRALLVSVSFPVPLTRDPAALGPLRLAARADWHEGAATIDELQIALDDTTASGRVELPSLSPLALRFQLAADRVDVDRYLEPEDAGGKPFELPLAALKKLDARGVLTIRQASMTGATAKELRIDVE
jgi:AsmA protein